MKALSRVALAGVGRATAVTVVMGLCVAILPLAPPVVIPFLALPLAHTVATRGIPAGSIVAVVSGALVYFVGGVGPGVLTFVLVLGAGTLLGTAVRRRWSFGKSLGSLAGTALAALVLWGVGLWLVAGVTLTKLDQAVDRSIADASGFYSGMGVDAATIETVSGQLRRIADVIPYLTPGLLGMGSILLAACVLGLSHWLFPRMRDKVVVRLSFSSFRMHWSAAYASIVGIAMLVFARGDGDWRTVVLYVGLNVLLVSQTLFFVQGLAVAHWLAVTRRYGAGARVALYFAAVVAQLIIQLTGLVGLFDTWLDYRKRFALKNPGPGPTG